MLPNQSAQRLRIREICRIAPASQNGARTREAALQLPAELPRGAEDQDAGILLGDLGQAEFIPLGSVVDAAAAKPGVDTG